MAQSFKISVIIPCYKQADFLSEAIESVLSQTYPNWECIIVNDGSPDDTEEIALSYCDKDIRIKYCRKENGGLSSARNAGIKMATGEYLQFLDADDVIEKDKLKLQTETFKEKPVDISVTNYCLFKGDITNKFENFLSQQPYKLTLVGFLYEWASTFVIPIHAGLFNRSFLEKNNIAFNESVRAREDWIFWCQSVLAEARFDYLVKKLAFYRVHSGAMTTDPDLMNLAKLKSYFEVYDLLPAEMKAEYRDRMSVLLVNQLSKSNIKTKNKSKLLVNKLFQVIFAHLYKTKK